MSDSISFFVAGQPQPKGSTRAFVVKGHAVTTSSNRNLKTWELRIAHEAQAKVPEGFCDGESAYTVDCKFYFARPKSYSKNYSYCHIKRPDVDKCLRAVMDALTGICWHDDAQVCVAFSEKRYRETPGVDIRVLKFHGRERIPR
jgi:crossover junction endodeoxyribonuclease RusA